MDPLTKALDRLRYWIERAEQVDDNAATYAVAQVRRYDWRVKVLRATKDGKEARA
jgi:hypothetical protein